MLKVNSYWRPVIAPAAAFFLAVASLAFIPAQPSLRAATISIGRYVLAPDLSQRMWIRVTGPGEQISRATMAMQIGDGGAFNGGSDTRPRFQEVSPQPFFGMFGANNTGAQVTNRGLVQTVDVGTRTGTVRALGYLPHVQIDTTGLTQPGSTYPFRLTNVAPNAPGPTLNTQLFDASGSPIPLTITNGNLFISYYGDANLDARVDASDFAILAWNFGKPGSWDWGDFTKDNRVDSSDFAVLANNFGRSASSQSAGVMSAEDASMLSSFADAHGIEGFSPAVPEPGAAGLAGAAALLALSRRRLRRRPPPAPSAACA